MIIDGKNIAQKVKGDVKREVFKLKLQGINPGLAVVLVGENPASKIYVRNKQKACAEVGIYSKEYFLPENISQEELINLIKKEDYRWNYYINLDYIIMKDMKVLIKLNYSY